MSKATLYTFGGSIWAAVPELALIELGYADETVERQVVNLIEGANFAPWFLKINPNATLPTLKLADGKVYTNTADVTSWLVKNASEKVTTGTDFITVIHEDKIDPNFAMLLARSDEELKAKSASVPYLFLKNRQESLLKNVTSEGAAEHKEFYDAKIAGNGGLLKIYNGEVPSEVKQGFFEQSKAHAANIRSFILDVVPAHLPESGFIGGERPGEDDFHLGAWFARIAGVAGGSIDKNGVNVLVAELGAPVPPKVVAYWAAWSARPSWKKVYADGLH